MTVNSDKMLVGSKLKWQVLICGLPYLCFYVFFSTGSGTVHSLKERDKLLSVDFILHTQIAVVPDRVSLLSNGIRCDACSCTKSQSRTGRQTGKVTVSVSMGVLRNVLKMSVKWVSFHVGCCQQKDKIQLIDGVQLESGGAVMKCGHAWLSYCERGESISDRCENFFSAATYQKVWLWTDFL